MKWPKGLTACLDGWRISKRTALRLSTQTRTTTPTLPQPVSRFREAFAETLDAENPRISVTGDRRVEGGCDDDVII
jgi:hypothetical protein